jgi:branched-subunit amino acid aminotransferase/4-amino-4-deoxychorismate lyase
MIVPGEIDDHLGLAARVGQVSADEFRRADGMFLTRTAGGLMPVATLDGKTSDLAAWV